MTKLLEMAVEAARQLSPAEQDELARAMFEMVNASSEPYVLSAEERAAIDYSLGFADRGEFASEEEVEALFAKYSR